MLPEQVERITGRNQLRTGFRNAEVLCAVIVGVSGVVRELVDRRVAGDKMLDLNEDLSVLVGLKVVVLVDDKGVDEPVLPDGILKVNHIRVICGQAYAVLDRRPCICFTVIGAVELEGIELRLPFARLGVILRGAHIAVVGGADRHCHQLIVALEALMERIKSAREVGHADIFILPALVVQAAGICVIHIAVFSADKLAVKLSRS